MSIDTTVLRILTDRDQFDKLFHSINLNIFDERTTVILKDFKDYFKEFPEHTRIKPEVFNSWFFSFQHPTLKDETKGFYKQMLKQVHKPIDDSTRKGIIGRILELEFATTCANLITSYESGEDIDIQRAIDEASETLKANLDRKTKVPWVNASIDDLLTADLDNTGLKWRLDCLNTSMRPLRPGDFGLIAGRPETGKTTFICSEVTNFAAQINSYYGDSRPIIWFNNEGPGDRIIKRLYQSALNASVLELLDLQKGGTLVDKYRKAVGGSLDNIRIADIHDMWNYDIVDILTETQPGLIIFDMIDNIKFYNAQGGPSSRTDQVLEGMYQWARVLGVRFKCPVIATSQISAEGDGLQFPTMSMLKDSKTGKQGTCDFQLMIGKSNEKSMENSRFIGLVRNKLQVEGFPKDPQQEVFFDGLRARYKMPQV